MVWTRNGLNICFLRLLALHLYFLLSILLFCYLVTALHGCIICMIVLVSNMFTLCAVGQVSIWNYKDRSQLATISPLILHPCREASQRRETKTVGTIIVLPGRRAQLALTEAPPSSKIRTSELAPDDPGAHRFRARKRTTPKFPSNSHPAKSFTKKLPAGRHFTNHPPDLNLDKTSPEPSAREFDSPEPATNSNS